MKAYIALPILCLLCTVTASGSIARRRLETNDDNALGNLMLSSEIGTALQHAVMVSQEDGGAGSSSSSSARCSSPSARWLQQQVASLSDEDLSNFFDWNVYTLAFAYKLYIEPHQDSYYYDQAREGEEYFGLDGEYTQEIHSIHDRARDFWSRSDDVQDDGIHVLCAHGSDLADRHNKLIPTLEKMFGNSYDEEYTVFDHANDIQDLITRLPGGYNYPLLTFNAFATDAIENENETPSIMIGAGYFEFQEAVGLSSEGPEYALSHEHAHHLQFTLGIPQQDDGYQEKEEDLRRQELMADALSAYFLAHEEGGTMSPQELFNIHEIAYSVGDCEIGNDGHHGTPVQRRCATQWGASISQDDDYGVFDLDLIELKDRFDAWYERVDDLDDSCETSASFGSFASGSIVHYGLPVLACLYGSLSLFG